MKRMLAAWLMILALLLCGCSKKVEEKAEVGYKPPTLVEDGTIQTGEKTDPNAQKSETFSGKGEPNVKDYSAQFSVKTAENTFSVFNLNLNSEDGEENRSYAARGETLIALLLQENPDIITFQEVGNGWMNFIVPRLGDAYGYYLIYPDSADKSSANPIFFKTEKFVDETGGTFWLSNTPDEESASADGKKYACTWLKLKDKKSERSVYVMNAQAGAALGKAGASVISAKGAGIGWKNPIICNIDLGRKKGSDGYNALMEQFTDANKDGITTATFHGYSSAGAVQDFCLYTKTTLTVNEYRVLTGVINGVAVSDHRPMITNYSINVDQLNYEGSFIF